MKSGGRQRRDIKRHISAKHRRQMTSNNDISENVKRHQRRHGVAAGVAYRHQASASISGKTGESYQSGMRRRSEISSEISMHQWRGILKWHGILKISVARMWRSQRVGMKPASGILFGKHMYVRIYKMAK